MATAAFLGSVNGFGSLSDAHSSIDKARVATWPSVIRSPSVRQAGVLMSCAKTPDATVSKASDNRTNGSTEKRGLRSATFPSAFEALLLEVCDETSVAEVQLKVGDFEMHLKRNVGGTNAPVSVAPPIPSEPTVQSAPAAPSTPKPSPEKTNAFANASSAITSKLAALDASGTDGYKLVTSPAVGSFRKGRTLKGKKQPPICKQGDVIKEGQVIGYVDQFGSELPVRSDVAGEVLKILFDEGEAIGYGDPLIVVLPSFHELNL